MKTIKAFGSLKEGGFYPKNPDFYYQQLKDAGEVSDCVVIIEGSNKRTIPQNNYAWMMFGKIAYALREKGYEEVTDEMLYYQAQEKYCGITLENKNTGGYLEMSKPLKKLPPDEFFNIMETIRTGFNENPNFDIEIETPAQFYGITEKSYDLMRMGTITYVQAKRMSDKELSEFES